MKNRLKKYFIKIPKNIKIIYCSKKKIIVLSSVFVKKFLKLNIQLLIINFANIIEVTTFPFFKSSKNNQKKLKNIRGTTLALLKQLVIEISTIFYQKLKLIGVGYRVFDIPNFQKNLLLLKLGYSHSIYFKVKSSVKIFCLKMTKLFVYGNSYINTTQTSSSIRSYKKPEPYKGKGIVYDREDVLLKKGKST